MKLGQVPKAPSTVAVQVQMPWKVWCFCYDLEQNNFFIINSVLLLIQMLCGESLDLGQLERKDIVPLKRSPKPPHVSSQGTILMLNAVVRSGLDYFLLCGDSVPVPGVHTVITERTFPWAQPHQLCCISIPDGGSWGAELKASFFLGRIRINPT